MKIDHFAAELARAHPAIREIWRLARSTKDPTRTGSQWALLAFADRATFHDLCGDLRFKRTDVELLVVPGDDEFCEPWGDSPERGYLSDWEWVKISEREAQYYGTTWVHDEKLFRTTIELCRATRLWPT